MPEDAAPPPAPRRRSGRSRVTTHGHLSHIAIDLFVRQGFDETTMDDIADAAGIGRRTLFRYYASKNDLPWGDFDLMLVQLADDLSSSPSDAPLADALQRAIVRFNDFPRDEMPFHRERMRLLLTVPTLLAHSTLRYAGWRGVIADYTAARLGVRTDDLAPQAVAGACLGVCLAAYDAWLRDPDTDLRALIESGFRELRQALGAVDGKDTDA